MRTKVSQSNRDGMPSMAFQAYIPFKIITGGYIPSNPPAYLCMKLAGLLSELTCFFPHACSWGSASGTVLWVAPAQEPFFCQGESVRSLSVCVWERDILGSLFIDPQICQSKLENFDVGTSQNSPQFYRPAIPKKLFPCYLPESINQ